MPEPLPIAAPFLFVLAQPQAKPWLSAEIAREHPGLRLAFNRPGLYTWKHPVAGFESDFRLRSVFARHHGFSLGQVPQGSSLAALVAAFERPLRLHVYARDPGERFAAPDPASLEALRSEILREHAELFAAEPTAAPGDWVLDVIVPPESGSDEPWFVGYHRHDADCSPHPGGVLRQPLPEFAPSRAYCKLEELLRFSSLPLRDGDVAVEIGCAPGGAAVALLDRGLRVIGVDPAEIDPRVVERARARGADFLHLHCPVAALRREQLPPKVDWLLCDANLAPQVAVRYLAHWVKLLRPRLSGLIFTMKMNDERAVSAIPQLLAQVAEFGLGAPRAVQLPSHRREIAVFVGGRGGEATSARTRQARP